MVRDTDMKAYSRGRGRVGGRVVINHTNTTGCHVSSNHDWALAGLELVQNPITFVLLFVAMDSFKTSITRIKVKIQRRTYRVLASHLGEESGLCRLQHAWCQ